MATFLGKFIQSIRLHTCVHIIYISRLLFLLCVAIYKEKQKFKLSLAVELNRQLKYLAPFNRGNIATKCNTL